MKKITNLHFFILIFLCLFFLFHKKKENEITLNVYNWGDFMATDINEQFTKNTGIKINYTTFQSNEEMLAKILGGGAVYDVIFPSDYTVARLIKEGVLEELNFSNIPNYSLIDSGLKNLKFDPENKYSVPYLWGILGIFYNSKFVDEEVIDWEILWNKKYKKKILMFDNPKDNLAIALLKNKKSTSSNKSYDWILAANELKNQRILVQNYMSDQIFDKLLGEEAYIAPFYYGHSAQNENLKNNKNIKFIIPKGGTNKFVDCACVLKKSEHKTEAEKYINFLCEQKNSSINSNVTGYMPANKESLDQLESQSEEIKNYDMKNANVYGDLPSEISKLNDDTWIKIRAGEEKSDLYSLILILIFSSLIILHMIVNLKRIKTLKE